MTRFAIDAPTLVHLVDADVPIDASHQLVAPNSIRSEALQLLLREVRQGTRSQKEALDRHERMTELKMRLLGDRVSRRTAWQMALDQNWDVLRDAEYVAIARLQADALITLNPDLAAKAQGMVPLASVQELRIPA
jgi:predicted nucleic acid-binding protein